MLKVEEHNKTQEVMVYIALVLVVMVVMVQELLVVPVVPELSLFVM